MVNEARAHVGCSGWNYKHWRGAFYPPGLATSGWLAYYARVFDTVEVNTTFYGTPSPEAVLNWRAQTPGGFLFAVKASRYLTHVRKLIDPADPLRRFLDTAGPLGDRLGPLLYQLPPRWRADRERLEAFLDLLPHAIDEVSDGAPGSAVPQRLRHAVEFRDPSWYRDDILQVLDARGVALCLHDRAGSGAPRVVVGGFVYVRFHGATGDYGGGYGRELLVPWADWLAARREAGCDVYAYFNNDIGAHAPRDAQTLRALLVGRAAGD